MFGIGFSELLVIAVILVVAVGPDRMPGMLKAVVRAYQEFRRATRELRASTGIDELLQDEDLRSLRRPLYAPPPAKKDPPKRSLSRADRERENPPEGVDLAEARHAEARSPTVAAERVREAKLAGMHASRASDEAAVEVEAKDR